MRMVARLATGLAVVSLGCAVSGDGNGSGTTQSTFTSATTSADMGDGDGDGETQDSGETQESGETGEKLDVDASSGCEAVDILFVVDNSESMSTYQEALTAQFPEFVDEMYAALPSGLSVHVGLTTTDFDTACDAAEATQSCQSTATESEILAHYVKPTEFNDGGNGSQGRLFKWSGEFFYETTTDEDPAGLTQWFSGAATAAGENGCSFEMPVAAAGWAADPVNADTNADFFRDEGTLLVVFFLTDEPDKSPENKAKHRDQLLAVKQACGGEACVFVSGLIPECTTEVNQKLWQFMNDFGDEPPPWGDITDVAGYSALVGAALAQGVAEACASVPVG